MSGLLRVPYGTNISPVVLDGRAVLREARVFIIVSFPIADARRFFSPDAIFNIPAWPLYDECHLSGQPLYVRNFGKVSERLRGGIDPWPGEDFFVDAKKAIRFRPPLKRYVRLTENAWGHFSCVFRRFYFDGTATSRIEIGFRINPTTWMETDPRQLEEILAPVLETQVEIHTGSDEIYSGPLISCCRALARHVEHGTKNRSGSETSEVEKSLVHGGKPLIFIESDWKVPIVLPDKTNKIDSQIGDAIYLESATCRRRGEEFNCWILNQGYQSDPETVRLTRVHLTRLHQAREVTKKVLQILAMDDWGSDLKPGDQRSDHLQHFLNESLGLIQRKKKYGFDQETILEAAYGADEIIAGRNRATILTKLNHIRGSIRRKLETAAKPTSLDAEIIVMGDVNNMDIRRTHTVGNQINFGDNANVSGNIVIAESIQNSFNAMPTENMQPELVDLIKQLSSVVEQAANKIDEPEAKQLSQDFETLTQEVANEKPRKQWVSMSLDSIVKTAEKAVEVGGKAAALAAKIAALF